MIRSRSFLGLMKSFSISSLKRAISMAIFMGIMLCHARAIEAGNNFSVLPIAVRPLRARIQSCSFVPTFAYLFRGINARQAKAAVTATTRPSSTPNAKLSIWYDWRC